MNPRVFACLFGLLAGLNHARASSEAGDFVFKTYSQKAYLASPQNWAALEDARGVMYFGNTDGLLEFDGVTWRRIPLPNAKAVRSLALTDKGVVYVGGQNEAGYLTQDVSGATRYVSILDKIDPKERKFGDVWSIVSTPAGVYFSTTERLILYNPNNGVRIWKAKGRLRRAFLIENVLHVQVSGVGLHRLDGEELKLAPGGEIFLKLDPRGAFQTNQGITIASSKEFFLKTAKGFEAQALPVAQKAQEVSIYSVAQIAPNLIAFGSTRGGLILADSSGKELRQYSSNSGLPSDYISGITVDRQGGVWLATFNGLIRCVPRLTYFGESSGLKGALTSLARWQESLYVGTTSGLFRLKASSDTHAPTFEPVAGMEGGVWSLSPKEKSLWVGSARGLFEYNGKSLETRSAAPEVVYDVSFARKAEQTLFAAMRSVAQILKFDGKAWSKTGEIPLAGEEFRSIADDENGILWATTRTSIVRADFNSTPPKIQNFTEQNGLPSGWKNVFRIGGKLLFATEKGLVKVAPSGERFVADPSLGQRFSDGSLGIDCAGWTRHWRARIRSRFRYW
ncbi:MAG: hypothetical protein NTW74_22505 [Acidobacteria bacterium]|nr:hypothetical protein [Acidobacteriota bacterium]